MPALPPGRPPMRRTRLPRMSTEASDASLSAWRARRSGSARSSASIRATRRPRAARRAVFRAATRPRPWFSRTLTRGSSTELRTSRPPSVEPSSTTTTSWSARVWRASDARHAGRNGPAFRTGRRTETLGAKRLPVSENESPGDREGFLARAALDHVKRPAPPRSPLVPRRTPDLGLPALGEGNGLQDLVDPRLAPHRGVDRRDLLNRHEAVARDETSDGLEAVGWHEEELDPVAEVRPADPAGVADDSSQRSQERRPFGQRELELDFGTVGERRRAGEEHAVDAQVPAQAEEVTARRAPGRADDLSLDRDARLDAPRDREELRHPEVETRGIQGAPQDGVRPGR